MVMTDMTTCRETVVQTGSPPTSHVRRKALDSGMSCNAVGGLVRHTRSLWELIVVDDGSTDGTGAQILSSGAPQILSPSYDRESQTQDPRLGW